MEKINVKVTPKMKSETSMITGVVRLSYAHLFVPKAVSEGQDEKYSVSLIIPKSDTETINFIKKAIENAKNAGVSKFGGKVPANLKTPLRDGDLDREDDENYKDCYFINATSKTKPGVILLDKSEATEEDVYSGCYARASVNFYAFNSNGNKGIACGLNNIQKLADGEALGGKVAAEKDFDDDLEITADDLL